MFNSASLQQAYILVDWGTSNFRAYLINSQQQVVNSVATVCPLASLNLTEQRKIFKQTIQPIQINGNPLPYLLVGMVGSNMGLFPTAYCDTEVSLRALTSKLIKVDQDEINGWVVPGLCGHSAINEVELMRGEETQILGWCLQNANRPLQSSAASSLLCLPGTHSKWVTLNHDKIERFSTVPTGEIFAKLSHQSTFCSGEQVDSIESFQQGVNRTLNGESLNEILFSTRTRVITRQMSEQVAASYLSGLLIGTEINSQIKYCDEQAQKNGENIHLHLIGNAKLNHLYQIALLQKGINCSTHDSESLLVSAANYLFSNLTSTSSVFEQLSTEKFHTLEKNNLNQMMSEQSEVFPCA